MNEEVSFVIDEAAEGTEASTAYMLTQARQALKAQQADSTGG